MGCVSISFLLFWKCGFRTKREIEFDCKFIIYTRILYKKNDSIFNSRFKLLYDKICKYCIVQFLWILFIIRCNQNYILFNHKVVVDEIWQDEMSFLFFKFIFSRTLEEIY